jgi:iron complex transport system substrate-binding protein
MRIVSLLPSATEMLYALGLGDQVVGVTHECDFPPEARAKPHLTRSRLSAGMASREIDAAVSSEIGSPAHSLYTIDRALLADLAPDLVVTQALCDVCAVDYHDVLAACAELPHQPDVLSTEPASLDDMLRDILHVGITAEVTAQAEALVASLRERIERVRATVAQASHKPRVAFLEWLDPIFCAGHWNPELIELAGGVDPLGRKGQDAVRIEWETVRAAEPEVIVVSCCGFDEARTRQDLPWLEAQPGWAQVPAVRTSRVHVTDGAAYFSRPGPRLVDSLELLARLLHPDLMGAG